MKKTIKVLGLLLTAAVMFMGCKALQEEIEGIEEPLFDASDCTKDTNKIKFTPGHWELRAITDGKDGSGAIELIFFIKKDASTVTGVNFDGDKECILKVSNNGDCSVYNDDQFKDFSTDSPEFAAYLTMSLLIYGSTEMDLEYEGLKTNSDNTKYYWSKKASDGDTVKYYLQKI